MRNNSTTVRSAVGGDASRTQVSSFLVAMLSSVVLATGLDLDLPSEHFIACGKSKFC